MAKFKSVSEYIAAFPPDVRKKLQQLRKAIKQAAPKADELISYNIPAFTLEGRLVYYAAFRNHLGFYPRASGIARFKKELAGYKGAKGSVQFALDEELPLGLIKRIVNFRVKENLEAAKSRKQRK
jgi:uncharacterized protein YdhG (YjbR/CyaY superfamily)